MTDLDPNAIPSTPTAATVTQVVGLIRIVVAGLAASGLTIGGIAAMSDSQLSTLVAAVLTVGGALSWIAAGVWSWWQKNAAAKNAHEAALASAIASSQATMNAGRPIAVALQPEKPA